ncbi:unnamed protein product [Paramecium pentaurelia]|uniref:Transmembrane protein n=1 Tax=Paramecium pentaurelia TaxID=43138 RepID=A0A8S1WIC1_9CILI|nr:unnamed protein product [Paramecium pentaurelia]
MQNQESEQNSLADTQQQVCQTYQATTEFFDQLPNCITSLKKQYLLDKASVNTRFVLLCLTTLTTAGLTARFTPSLIKLFRCRSLHCTRSVQPVLNIQIMIIIVHKIQLMNINFLSSLIITLLVITLYYILDSILYNICVIFILVFYFIIRFICRLMAFPGSYQLFYKYNFLLTFNEEKIYQTRQELKFFRYLDDNSSQYQFQKAKNFFLVQQKIYQQMEGQLNQQQINYLNLLSNYIEVLESQQNQQIIKNETIKLQQFLNAYMDQSAQIKYIMKPFKQQILFGTLEWCRLEILQLNPNASRHIIKYKNNLIDCIHIVNNKSNGQTVLFCNPNAGYYEYQYINCTWFKIYQSLQINVILWNYCKYGQSTGTLTTENIIECGIFVVQYFQNKFQIKTLGIHGLSLGGMFASEIAQKLNLSFLIADRTFSSLGQIAAAIFLLNCIVNWDYPNYLSFYNFKGPKLIIQDAVDEIIPYIAQLQTSLVRQYFTNQTYSPFHSYFNQESKQYMDFFFKQILSENQTVNLSQSLQTFINFNEQKNNNQLSENQHFYQESKKLLQLIEYSNNDIFKVMDSKPTPEKIALFFGSCFMFDQNSFQTIKSIIKRIQILLKQHHSQYNQQNLNNQLSNHVEVIIEHIYQIIKSFQSTKQVQELRKRKKQKIFGHLITINCGHNNNLNMYEAKRFQDYFLSNFIL